MSGCVKPVGPLSFAEDEKVIESTDVTITFYSWSYATSENIVVRPPITIDRSSAIGSTNMPPDPTQPDYMFLGWWDRDGHKDGGADIVYWGTQVTFATKVSANMNVYARWLGTHELGRITLRPLGDTPIQVYASLGSVAEASYMNVPNSGMGVFMINNAESFSAYEWIFNGSALNSTPVLTFINNGGTGDINTGIVGTYLITIRALTNEGKWESSYFYVVVH